jgi:hypothetical protein
VFFYQIYEFDVDAIICFSIICIKRNFLTSQSIENISTLYYSIIHNEKRILLFLFFHKKSSFIINYKNKTSRVQFENTRQYKRFEFDVVNKFQQHFQICRSDFTHIMIIGFKRPLSVIRMNLQIPFLRLI